jgi:hypothetical protein
MRTKKPTKQNLEYLAKYKKRFFSQKQFPPLTKPYFDKLHPVSVRVIKYPVPLSVPLSEKIIDPGDGGMNSGAHFGKATSAALASTTVAQLLKPYDRNAPADVYAALQGPVRII